MPVWRLAVSGLAGLVVGIALAEEPKKDPPPVEETRSVKFDPSFEKSLWGVQDAGKWQISRTLHVDAGSAVADDKGPGSEERPLKTIAKAVELAGPGTRVLVHPGVYHEGIAIRKGADKGRDRSGTADAPIVIESMEPGKAILTGSDVWTEWKSEGKSVFSAPWPHKWGFNRWGWMGEMVKPLGQRSEVVYFDELPLRQVLKREEMTPRTFCVDEENGRIHIQLMDGEWPQHHRIEVSVRRDGISVGDPWNRDALPSYIAIRGFEVRHFAENLFLGRHVLLEDCRFIWNSGTINLGGEDYVIRRNTAMHIGHGAFGIPPGDTHLNGLLEDNVALYNNWRLGGYGKLNGWAMGGMKVMTLRNLIIRRARIEYNDCPGIWTDNRCNNVLIENSVIAHNRMNGIWIEISNGETVVRNNTIAFNDTGLCISNTCNLTIEGNTFYGNFGSQIGNWHASYGRDGFRSVGLKIINNALVATKPRQNLIDLPGFDYIVPNTTLAGNLYSSPDGQGFVLGSERMDFARWRQKFQQDKVSILTDPKFRNPEALDFAPLPGSPLLDRKSWSMPISVVHFDSENRVYSAADKPAVHLRAEPDGAIHYTTDGSEPTAGSSRYSGPIPLVADTRIRAKVIGDALSPYCPISDASFICRADIPAAPQLPLGDLKPVKATVGWGDTPRINRTIMDRPLTVDGCVFAQGIGAHAPSEIVYDIPANAKRFVALVGVDDEAEEKEKAATVTFELWIDQQRVFQSGLRRRGMPWVPVSIDLPNGSRQLRLVITDAGDGQDWDHGDWLRAGFVTTGF